MKLTDAQVKALAVLADADEPVRGWKRRSVAVGDPMPRPWEDKTASRPHVNMIAAASLVRLRLAKAVPFGSGSPFTHDYEYELTGAGWQEVAVAEGVYV